MSKTDLKTNDEATRSDDTGRLTDPHSLPPELMPCVAADVPTLQLGTFTCVRADGSVCTQDMSKLDF